MMAITRTRTRTTTTMLTAMAILIAKLAMMVSAAWRMTTPVARQILLAEGWVEARSILPKCP